MRHAARPAFDENWKSYRAIRSFQYEAHDFQPGATIDAEIMNVRRRRQLYEQNRIWPVADGIEPHVVLADIDAGGKPPVSSKIAVVEQPAAPKVSPPAGGTWRDLPWMQRLAYARSKGYIGKTPSMEQLELYFAALEEA